MKYLKQFNFISEYDSFVNSEDYVTPNVSFIVENEDVRYAKQQDFIIMTYESNPAVMDVCYYQGWAASPDVMYKSEAEKVTDIGTAFKGLQGNSGSYGTYGDLNLTGSFTSFDEFKYFTGVTSIDRDAFYNCSELTSIVIPSSVTSIGDYAFSGCTSLPVIDDIRYADTYLVEATDKTLTTYNIKEGTKFIGSDAFASCFDLTSINIPNSVISIGYDAFWGCGLLTSINIPNSVTSIGDKSFFGCWSLTSIVIPSSVTTIGERAFQNCTSLSEITCLATTAPSIQYYTFENLNTDGILYVPVGSDYSSWMNYLNEYNWTSQEI